MHRPKGGCYDNGASRSRDSRSENASIFQVRDMPTLETERLILRSFRQEDVDAMVQLFANADFMRFSLGVFTERKKTVDFIEKVMGWDRANVPSQFAVVPRDERTIVGYCGFHHHPEV